MHRTALHIAAQSMLPSQAQSGQEPHQCSTAPYLTPLGSIKNLTHICNYSQEGITCITYKGGDFLVF